MKDERSRVAFGLLAANDAAFTEEEREELFSKAFLAAIRADELWLLELATGEAPARPDEEAEEELELDELPSSLLMLTN